MIDKYHIMFCFTIPSGALVLYDRSLCAFGHLRTGFRKILTMVLSLKEKGLLVGGPPCGSWIWINRSTRKRNKNNIFGTTLKYVQDANTKLAQIAADA